MHAYLGEPRLRNSISYKLINAHLQINKAKAWTDRVEKAAQNKEVQETLRVRKVAMPQTKKRKVECVCVCVCVVKRV
jgi:hypothetical protein